MPLDRPASPGILLDRDGTIIADRGYVWSVDRVEFPEGSPLAAFEQFSLERNCV